MDNTDYMDSKIILDETVQLPWVLLQVPTIFSHGHLCQSVKSVATNEFAIEGRPLYFFPFTIQCNASVGARKRNKRINRTCMKKFNISSPSSFSSILKKCWDNDTQESQNVSVITPRKMANKTPIMKVLKRKFLKKIILCTSIGWVGCVERY